MTESPGASNTLGEISRDLKKLVELLTPKEPNVVSITAADSTALDALLRKSGVNQASILSEATGKFDDLISKLLRTETKKTMIEISTVREFLEDQLKGAQDDLRALAFRRAMLGAQEAPDFYESTLKETLDNFVMVMVASLAFLEGYEKSDS